MKCLICSAELTGKQKKYCSRECSETAHKEKMRMEYTGKREKVCRQCGCELPKFKTRFCSDKCSNLYGHIKRGEINHPEILIKICPVCGKEFKTWKSRKNTCSPECSKRNKRQYDPEKERAKYLKKHPNARTMDEILKAAAERERIRQEEITERAAKREEDQAKKRAEKEKKKQENIAQWLEYEAEHKCVVCNKPYIAHYPTSKYCSKTCQRKVTRIRKRYDGITIDRDISLFKLAERDHNQCQICGLYVDWTDREEIKGTVICGDMYPSIDHIKPISRGGLHSWDNVQLAHRRCNTCKNDRWAG